MNWENHSRYKDIILRIDELRKKESPDNFFDIAQTIKREFSISGNITEDQISSLYRRAIKNIESISNNKKLKINPDEIIKPEVFKEKEIHPELQRQIKKILYRGKVITHPWGKKFKIGIISDTQYGSLYANQNLVESLYKKFKEEGCDAVYHPGDLVDGYKMYRGHEFEVADHGCKAQRERVIKDYPDVGLTTYWIRGNHDDSFWKNFGEDIGELIGKDRKDLICIGREEEDIRLGENENAPIIRLYHGSGGGTTYALSYQIQKYIESLSGGQKPDIIIMGHHHKLLDMPCYRNIFAILGGTTQSQTPFMKGKKAAAHLGGYIIEGKIDKQNRISNFKQEIIVFFEESIKK